MVVGDSGAVGQLAQNHVQEVSRQGGGSVTIQNLKMVDKTAVDPTQMKEIAAPLNVN